MHHCIRHYSDIRFRLKLDQGPKRVARFFLHFRLVNRQRPYSREEMTLMLARISARTEIPVQELRYVVFCDDPSQVARSPYTAEDLRADWEISRWIHSGWLKYVWLPADVTESVQN